MSHFVTDCLVPPVPQDILLESVTEEIMVNRTVLNLTCTVSRIKPQATIYWMIQGQRENGSDSVTTNDDGTFRQTSTIRYFNEYSYLVIVCLMCFKVAFKILNTTGYISFSITDEDDIRCIVDPIYGDTVEVERPTTHSRKYSKISSETTAQ